MKYEIPLYPTKHILTLIIEKDINQSNETAMEIFDDIYIDPPTHGDCAFAFSCISKGERHFVIGIAQKTTPQVILHEAIHTTWHLAGICGFKYENDQEFQCYLAEYIYENIIEHKKNSKMKAI